ncbi:GTP-binding protein [Paenibacillus alkaliterrae]|uniref:GTP-binding protein n=1 Tax=Paenibacillus alkaliterrae TaxID=320909 RepID=UPI001F158D34|nr:GTP-binding protein [Paenibacillus alkaliterrae]MCF2938341.1 GTP-binding protein [Paenibacillus alkaliterrae]
MNIKGVKQRIVFQGIHMLFSSTPDRDWRPGEARNSEIVIIGRNLDQVWFQVQFSRYAVDTAAQIN